ncbi:MAG: hypothetical protein PSN46_09410 [Gammaproteobacteria bacterium]|nr:hypothetical protein [Gammaproteobacteria bacterium]
MAIISNCEKGFRCRKWKECEHCSRIRQAQIASLAEEGAATSPHITYAVTRTYSQKTISKDRTDFIKRLNRAVNGGIWTIETADITGLHVNILLGSDKPIDATKLAGMWGSSSADIWAAEIPRKDVRNVAAYCSKKESFPNKEEYQGRLYGSFGEWKRPLALLAENKSSPVVAGAALDGMLAGLGVPEPEPEPEYNRPSINGYRKPKGKELKELLKKNDKKVALSLKQHEQEKNRVARENHLKRLLAAHRGEIELKGFVYVNGWGILHKSDLIKHGFPDVPSD